MGGAVGQAVPDRGGGGGGSGWVVGREGRCGLWRTWSKRCQAEPDLLEAHQRTIQDRHFETLVSRNRSRAGKADQRFDLVNGGWTRVSNGGQCPPYGCWFEIPWV